MSEPGQVQRRSWWSRNWKWVVPVGCVTPLLVCGGLFTLLFTLIFGLIKQSGAYQDSLALVRADERVTAVLGEPIEPGWLVSGSVNTSGASGNAVLSYTVSGPRGKGTVYLEATMKGSRWVFDTLEFDTDATDPIDLLDEP